MNNNIIYRLFPEPVFKYKLENFQNFNQDLTNYIYELRQNDDRGLNKSNKGGWHSNYFKLGVKDSIQHKFTLEIQKYIIDVFQKYGWKTKNVPISINEMWAIINRNEDFNVLHSHPNCYLSAAYYVKAPPNCGKFEIECPNIAKLNSFPSIEKPNDLNVRIVSIDISEGDLLIFPNYLPHKVAKNQSNDDRIVISFNVGIK
ncbi:TIGR02466 family protein [Candidatus Pelagibacter sp.]|uniref:TIGR02466 family protein n=1 Tax=Candidatus Pelagibacter sp. TaxID=2024849 RepID=UPI003D0B1F36